MLPRHYIIGFLMFTLMIGIGVSMLGIFNANVPDYGSNGSELSDFNETFYKLDDISDTVGELESGITNASTDFGAFGVLNSLISGAWQTVKLLFNSLSFTKTVFAGLGTFFGVPSFVIRILTLMITAIIAFAIYSAIFQREI